MTIVERSPGRCQRLRHALENGLGGTVGVTWLAVGWGFHVVQSSGFVQGPSMATDLTGANANVYLEVGYAWGRGKPTCCWCAT